MEARSRCDLIVVTFACHLQVVELRCQVQFHELSHSCEHVWHFASEVLSELSSAGKISVSVLNGGIPSPQSLSDYPAQLFARRMPANRTMNH